MSKDLGAIPGSRPTDQAPSGLGGSRFDPERWAALREAGSWPFFGNAEPICPHCAAHCSINENEWWHLYSDDDVHEVSCPSCDRDFTVRSSASWAFSTDDQDAMIEEDAIATEARRAETENTGSVHEGAGPQDIAQKVQP